MDGFEVNSRAFPNYPINNREWSNESRMPRLWDEAVSRGENQNNGGAPLWLKSGETCQMLLMTFEKQSASAINSYSAWGRVGKGAEQSYCVLWASMNVQRSRVRLDTMVRTNDGLRSRIGFEIAGTRRSWWKPNKVGITFYWLLDWSKERPDFDLSEGCRLQQVLANDPTLNFPKRSDLRQIRQQKKPCFELEVGLVELVKLDPIEFFLLKTWAILLKKSAFPFPRKNWNCRQK